MADVAFPAFPGMNSPARLAAIHAEVEEAFVAGGSGEHLVHLMCRRVDELLRELWQLHPALAELDLVAVGGYGRGELAPRSDWDLWFLLPGEASPETGAAIQSLLHTLWDMRIKIGHAVRDIDETMAHLAEDWNSTTAASEARLVAGEGRLFGELQRRVAVFLGEQRCQFVQAKMAEFAARSERMGGTAFLMEPDVKEGRGGLRDIQALFWIARAWYRVERLHDLVATGALSARELRHLEAARRFFWRCRVGLHLLSRRGSDRLGFEQQVELAERLGYRDHGHQSAVDRFMRDYFRHAGRTERIGTLLLAHFKEELAPPTTAPQLDLGDGFTLRGNIVDVADEGIFEREPKRLLRIFHITQQEHRYLSSRALRLIREQVRMITPEVRRDPEMAALFLSILRHPRNVAWALRSMNVTGVLGRLIPPFRRVVGLGQFNRYHAFTIDEHTLRAVKEARNLRLGAPGSERLILSARVIQEIKRPELLYLALIFHDIAKALPGDHSVEGEKLAIRFCRQLGLGREAVDLVGWLVRHHLEMAMVSQRSDLADAAVIRAFADKVGDMERLQYLLLLTVADIRAVGPQVWNDWKGALLRELYNATERLLMGERIESDDQERRHALRLESVLDLASREERAQLMPLLRHLPRRAVLTILPAQLLAVARMLAAGERAEGVEVMMDSQRGDSLLIVLAKERAGLFANLTATIASGHLSVVAASAFELPGERVLDLFHVQAADGTPITVRSDLERLQHRLRQTLATGRAELRLPDYRINVLMRQVAVEAHELPLASARQTAIELTAPDRPGLLATLAQTIAALGFDLRGAAISTFGEKAVDVFFLRTGEGSKLSPAEIASLCAALERAASLKKG